MVLACVLFAPAYAQNTVTLSASVTSGAGQVVTNVQWATNPPAPGATPCTASGLSAWSGVKAASGSQSLTLSSSATLNLSCTWPGGVVATATWTNPTTNCGGAPYTDAQQTVLRYSSSTNPSKGPTSCSAPAQTLAQLTSDCGGAVQCTQNIAPSNTMRTITGLAVGTWQFTAYSCNALGWCSGPSNVASKAITGNVTVTESVGITVNPVPSPIAGLAVQ